MMIKNLLLQFYRLSMEESVCLLLLCTLLFCGLKPILERYRWWKPAVICFMAALTVTILFTTLGRRGGGEYQINLIPFHSYRAVKAGANPELYRSNFMNAAMFYPAGLLLTSLLPKRWPGWCRCLLTAAVFAALSAGVEYAQYRWSLGNVEIDDVIHNTVGALTGSLAFPVFSALISVAEKWIREKSSK